MDTKDLHSGAMTSEMVAKGVESGHYTCVVQRCLTVMAEGLVTGH